MIIPSLVIISWIGFVSRCRTVPRSNQRNGYDTNYHYSWLIVYIIYYTLHATVIIGEQTVYFAVALTLEQEDLFQSSICTRHKVAT